MLEYLCLKNVGPAPEMELAPRLNLITGDNGLGKSFLFDVAWWPLPRRWPAEVNPGLTLGLMVGPARPEELPKDWDPLRDERLTVWETVHQLIRVLEHGGESAAAELVAKLGSQAEVARELASRLYTVCERKKRAQEALSYNSLVQSWPEITRLARDGGVPAPPQKELF